MARSWNPNSISWMLVALVGIGAIGCQRNVTPEMKSITISLPSPATRMVSKAAGRVAAMNVEYENVIINVHASPAGGGILATKSLAAHQGPIPSSVTLTIPNGSNRLVQVLVAGKVPNQGGYTFLYDDAVVSLSGGSQSVFILPVEVGSSGEGEGQIGGRMLTSATTGPTGPLNIYVQPPGTVPKMLLQSGYVFGGYFSTFYVDDAGFEYFLPQQGIEFFPEGLDITTVQAQIASTSLSSQVIVQHPSMYEYAPWDSPQYRYYPQGKALFGWFNLTAQSDSAIIGSRKMAYEGSGPPLANSSGYPFGVSWNGSSVTGSISWVTSPSGSSAAGPLVGGTSSTAGTEYVDYFLVNSQRFGKSGLGREGGLGFAGPYRFFQTGSDSTWYWDSQPVQRKISQGNVRVETQYLPQVMDGSDGITGSVILYKAGVNQDGAFDAYYGDGEGMNCAKMIADGFSVVSMSAPVNGQSYGIVDLPEAVNCSSVESVATAICPVRGSEVIDYGVAWKSGYNSCVTDPLKFAVPTPASSLSTGACIPLSIQLQDSTGFEWTSSNHQNIGVQFGETGSANIYVDSDCSIQQSASTMSYYSSSRNMVFYKSDSSIRALSAWPNTAGSAGTTINVEGGASYSAPDLIKLYHRESSVSATEFKIEEHACTEFLGTAFAAASGAANTVTSAKAVTWTTSIPELTYYSDPGCTVPSASSTIDNNESITPHFARVSGIPTETTGTIVATGAGWTSGTKNLRIKAAYPATYSMVQGDPSNWNNSNQCKSLEYRLYSTVSGGGAPAEFTSANTLAFTDSLGWASFDVYSSSSDCQSSISALGQISSGSTMTFPVAAGFHSANFWFRPVVNAATTLNVQIWPISTPSMSAGGPTWYQYIP